MMKNILIIFFLLVPLLTIAYSPAYGQEAPPVAQVLVREGDFAVRLAETLKIGSPVSEAEAMSALAAAGIAPRNGWIADYPMTPDIMGELEAAVVDAADTGRLVIARDEALHAFQGLASEFGLAVTAAVEAGDLPKEPPESYPLYSDPTVVHNHYYNVGPPVVTYYPPPTDYFYLYAWVPYPFYWHTYWFPGFFILHDFNRVVFVRQKFVKVVTNHIFVPRFRRVVTVDHRSRARGTIFEDGRRLSDRRRFDSPEAQLGAASIVERSRSRGRSGDSSVTSGSRGGSAGRTDIQRTQSRREGSAFTNTGPGSGTSRDGRTESFSRPGTGRRSEGRRFERRSDNRGPQSFNRPDSSGSRTGRSFDRPSGTGRNRFDAAIGNQGRSSGSFRGSNSPPSIQSGSSGGTNFQRPSGSETINRSLSSTPMRSFSINNRGSARQEMRGGGSGSRGSSARGRVSGGGCRGRC